MNPGEALVLALTLFAGQAARAPRALPVFTITPPPPDRFHRFYRKHIDLNGFPIIGSRKVSNYALREAAYIIHHMLEPRPDVRDALIDAKIRLVVMAHTELTTHIPEHADLKPKIFWDRRARGLGPTAARPAVSCAAENLLHYPGDPYDDENILIHEFAHAIHLIGLNRLEPTFQKRLEKCFRRAKRAKLWQGTYAGSSVEEYWAEGVQSWFDANHPANHDHNGINTRSALEAYDPPLAALIADTFRGTPWRYQPPWQRAPMHREHLRGYQRSRAPSFAWSAELDEWFRVHMAKQTDTKTKTG